MDGKKTMAFAAGALVAPVVSGFAARALASPRTLNLPPLATRGVLLGGTTISLLLTQQPFTYGAFLGQLAPTVDMVAELIADQVLGGAEVAALPRPAVAGLRLASAEAFAERAAAGQVTPEDIREMEALKQDLAHGGVGDSYAEIYEMSGVSDQRRVGFQTGEIAAARRVTSF